LIFATQDDCGRHEWPFVVTWERVVDNRVFAARVRLGTLPSTSDETDDPDEVYTGKATGLLVALYARRPSDPVVTTARTCGSLLC